MNERIKQLAAKANFGHMENNEVVYDTRLEKFAKLIVRECCQKLEDDGMVEIAIEMKQHFGIKE